ncbi:MAG: 3-methyladenine DNA glycosylase [Thermoplasmata archaeon]|nr:MAG: 3-methyladenine DNA glycosylase [Thermoplasmata archaeon]
MPLPKKFYNRDAALVAKELLGCIFVKRDGKEKLKGKIVETEAYYGLGDPASRARDKRIGSIMNGEAGIIFIYMVHGNWLFNITTMPHGNPSGILIRAVEPLAGIEIMKKRRKTDNIKNLTSGPGKFTQAFGIDKKYNGIKIYSRNSPIYIEKKKENEIEIVESYRIGVKEDLPVPLRFYIKGNKFVSKP